MGYSTQKVAEGLLIGIGVITILVQIVVILGVYIENLWITFIYLLMVILISLGSIAGAFKALEIIAVFCLLNIILILVLVFIQGRELKEPGNDYETLLQ